MDARKVEEIGRKRDFIDGMGGERYCGFNGIVVAIVVGDNRKLSEFWILRA